MQTAVQHFPEVAHLLQVVGSYRRFVAQRLSSLNDTAHYLGRILLGEGSGMAGRPVLWRIFIGYEIGAIGRLGADVLQKLGRFEHGGQSAAQEFSVERIAVVLPKVRAVPCRQRLDLVPHPLRGSAKDVGLCRHHPSAHTALVALCHAVEIIVVGGEGDDVVQKWQVHRAEVGDFGRPVVHLNIDVGVDVAVPETGIRVVVPDALQVGGSIDEHVVAAYFQVASVLEI